MPQASSPVLESDIKGFFQTSGVQNLLPNAPSSGCKQTDDFAAKEAAHWCYDMCLVPYYGIMNSSK